MFMKKSYRIIIALLIASVCMGAGCKKKTPPRGNPYDSLYDKFSEITLAGHQSGSATYVLDGFSLSWKLAPHCFDRLGAGLLLVRADDVKNKLSAVARLAMQSAAGGPKDALDYSLDYTLARSGDVDFYHGEVMDIDMSGGAGERDVAVNLPDAGMYIRPGDGVAVFLRGFYLNADRGDEGDYPIKSFSAGIAGVRVEGNKVLFTAGMGLETGAKDLYSENKGKNKVEGKLFYTIAVARGGAVTASKIEYGAPGADSAGRAVSISGKPGAFPLAFAGIQGFRIEVKGYPVTLGRLRFGNSGFEYNAASGVMKFNSGAGAERGGAAATEDKVAVSAQFALVQFTGADGIVRHGGIKGAADGPFAERKIFSMRSAVKFQTPPQAGAAPAKQPAAAKTK
jgi:hypothetical protein